MKLHHSITLRKLEKAVRSEMFGLENPGFCIACGSEHGGCEPDAREYPCGSCGKKTVYGAQEIMMEIV